jgi:hypothetical protein
MTDKDMDWLKSHGILSEVEVLKLVSQVMLKRNVR